MWGKQPPDDAVGSRNAVDWQRIGVMSTCSVVPAQRSYQIRRIVAVGPKRGLSRRGVGRLWFDDRVN